MTEEYPSVNAEEQIGKEGSIYEFYKEMIAFRQSGPYKDCLIYGKICPVESSENVIAYKRYTEDETIYCWFNFGNEESVEELEPKNLKQIWSNDKTAQIENHKLRLQPFQALLLKEIEK